MSFAPTTPGNQSNLNKAAIQALSSLKISGVSADHIPQLALLHQFYIRDQSSVFPNVREQNFNALQ